MYVGVLILSPSLLTACSIVKIRSITTTLISVSLKCVDPGRSLIYIADLDAFCYAIQRELHEVTAVSIILKSPTVYLLISITIQHISPDPRSCVFSKWNMPFAPEDHRTADQIVSDATHPYHHQEHGRHSMRKTMLRCWKQVDVVTRSTV